MNPVVDGNLPSPLRRRLCQLVGAFFLGYPLSPGLAVAAPSQSERAALTAFLDRLLPRDDRSGSASDLGIIRPFWAFAETDANFQRLVSLGGQWLNLTGRGTFAALPPTQQDAIIDWMASSDWNEIPRRFYELVRQVGIELYYSQPAATAGLPVQRPPQPEGYPPPWV